MTESVRPQRQGRTIQLDIKDEDNRLSCESRLLFRQVCQWGPGEGSVAALESEGHVGPTFVRHRGAPRDVAMAAAVYALVQAPLDTR